MSSNERTLSHMCWDNYFELQKQEINKPNLKPARVISEERQLYRVECAGGNIFWSQMSGKGIYQSKERSDLPVVGDWILVDKSESSDRGLIRHILKRKNWLHRKQAGRVNDPQPLAANIDYAFIATSLNEDFNLRRLERYYAVVTEAKITPIILLTKSDLCENLPEKMEELRKLFPQVALEHCTEKQFEASLFFAEYLTLGTTSVVLGSSGVGKSTLIGYLSGQEILTQGIREEDGKGRHTTTSRNLYFTKWGGAVIDTPGMRELQLFDHADALQNQFGEIDELIRSCRFRDCNHQIEQPGCAVQKALDHGTLDEKRWRNYWQLHSEVEGAQKKKAHWKTLQEKKARLALIDEARAWGQLKRKPGKF